MLESCRAMSCEISLVIVYELDNRVVNGMKTAFYFVILHFAQKLILFPFLGKM
jgi:hypothetical protein